MKGKRIASQVLILLVMLVQMYFIGNYVVALCYYDYATPFWVIIAPFITFVISVITLYANAVGWHHKMWAIILFAVSFASTIVSIFSGGFFIYLGVLFVECFILSYSSPNNSKGSFENLVSGFNDHI